jgi:hypothetical protein
MFQYTDYSCNCARKNIEGGDMAMVQMVGIDGVRCCLDNGFWWPYPSSFRLATIDCRCDDEKNSVELGRHLGIIA